MPFGAGPPEERCSVRLAKPDDHEHLENIVRRTWGASCQELLGQSGSDLLGTSNQQIYLTFLRAEPIGCLFAVVDDATILHGLAVLSEHRGNGYGKSLLSYAINDINATAEAGSYWTAVEPSASDFEDRFRSLGFHEYGRPGGALTGLILLWREAET